MKRSKIKEELVNLGFEEIPKHKYILKLNSKFLLIIITKASIIIIGGNDGGYREYAKTKTSLNFIINRWDLDKRD